MPNGDGRTRTWAASRTALTGCRGEHRCIRSSIRRGNHLGGSQRSVSPTCRPCCESVVARCVSSLVRVREGSRCRDILLSATGRWGPPKGPSVPATLRPRMTADIAGSESCFRSPMRSRTRDDQRLPNFAIPVTFALGIISPAGFDRFCQVAVSRSVSGYEPNR